MLLWQAVAWDNLIPLSLPRSTRKQHLSALQSDHYGHLMFLLPGVWSRRVLLLLLDIHFVLEATRPFMLCFCSPTWPRRLLVFVTRRWVDLTRGHDIVRICLLLGTIFYSSSATLHVIPYLYLLLSIFLILFKNLVLINRLNGPRYQRVLALYAFLNSCYTEGINSSKIVCLLFVYVLFYVNLCQD